MKDKQPNNGKRDDMEYHSTYKKCNIYKKSNGWWTSYCAGRFISADTLSGLRQFITKELKAERTVIII